MTTQFHDSFRYRKRDYALAGISAGVLFDPALLELKPTGTCSACSRGYVARFAISKKRLVLAELHLNLLGAGDFEREEGPTIQGVAPTGPRDERDWCNNHYVGLSCHLEYTGGVLLVDGFNRELYAPMGLHPWKYERVVELIFAAGALTAERDHSKKMAALRRRIVEAQDADDPARAPSPQAVTEFIEQVFDRSYPLDRS